MRMLPGNAGQLGCNALQHLHGGHPTVYVDARSLSARNDSSNQKIIGRLIPVVGHGMGRRSVSGNVKPGFQFGAGGPGTNQFRTGASPKQ